MSTPRFEASDDLFAPTDGHSPFMEGMATYAVDPGRNTSLLMGLYRDFHDAGQSWHNLAVNLPDGRAAIAIDYPPLQASSTIQSGNLRYTQVEPFSHWRYSFDGAAEYARQEDTLKLGSGKRDLGRLSFEFDIRCATPPWSPPASVFASRGGPGSEPNLFGFYVQTHRFAGWVRDDSGARWEVEGSGWRHHVRCPPWGGAIFGHSFIHVLFPSGRAFGLQVAELTKGEISGFGYVFDGEALHQCAVRSFTSWSRLIPRGEPVKVVLEREGGATVEITGETLNNIAVMNLSERPGLADLSDPEGLLTLFGDTRWAWDGEIGYGTWERTKLVRGLSL
jgi:hypothetical protein